MMHSRPRLEELVDRKYLQRLQDVISQSANVTTIILDSLGNPVTQMSNPSGFCELGAKSEKHKNICDETHGQLFRKARKAGKLVTGICPHSGLVGAAIPFFLGTVFVGVWIVSQIRLDDMKAEPLAGGVREKELEPEEARLIIENMPIRSQAEFDLVLNFLSILTKEIIELASGRASLMKKNEKLLALTQKLKYSMDSFQAIFNTAGVGMVICDFYTAEIILCNSTHAAYFGLESEETLGRRCYELLGRTFRCEECPCDKGKFFDEDGKPVSSYTQESHIKIKDDEYWFQTTYRVIHWIDGRLAYIITYIDITERRLGEENLSFLAFWDKNMQIPNLARMEQDIINNTSYECLIVLNIRGLKKINNIYGRDCGDALLRAVRDYIYEMRIPDSTLYRMEDADFGILLKKKAKGSLTRQVAQNIRNRCEKPWEIVGKWQRHNIFIDVNVCIIPIGAAQRASFNNLYGAIDHTLDVARTGDGMALYDDKAHEKFQANQRMELILKNAVHENMRGFSIVYQPIITPNVSLWSGVEALCRWEIPELGKVSPSHFIPIAERSGVICAIGLWVLEQSLIQVCKWKLDKLDNFLLEVNLSTVQLNEPYLAQSIEEILKKHKYPPQKLCLEITESSEMMFSKHTVEVLERLNKIGVIIALDDFGTGYTSFKMLHELPVKVLKTDRTLLDGIDNNAHLQRLFYVMVELARVLDMRIVAEGVEIDSQVQYLLKQGVDFFQGYFFSHPLTKEEMEKKLDNFYKPTDVLLSLGFHKLDLSRLGDKQGGHDLDPRLYKILNKCMREMFFSDADGDDAINIALANIGEGMHVSRAYLFLKEPDGTYSNTHEWCERGIKPAKEELQNMPIAEKYPTWIDLLEKQGFLVVSDIKTLEKGFCEFLEQYEVKAMVNLPIRKKGRICGFVGFDCCLGRHGWALEEVQMLHTLTGIIVSVLGKMWLRDEVAVHNKMREIILDNTSAFIYVSDMKTNEILFASTKLQEMHGNKNLIGRPCWEALRMRTEKCPFCPQDQLLKNPHESYRWEFYDEKLKRYFKAWDIIIPWINNEPAHLGFAEDITELKRPHNKPATLAAKPKTGDKK